MKCNNCGDPNPGPGPFCMACGRWLSEFPANEDSTHTAATQVLQEPLPGALAASLRTGDVFAEQRSAEPAPASPESQLQPEIGQIGNAGTIPFSTWGPFAGRGTRGRHASWLLNDKGLQAEELRDAVIERFIRRAIPDADVEEATLVRRGILVDTRPFFLVQRRLTSVGLYLARFGQDLYISQVTYSKRPIDGWRIVLLILMILFILAYTVAYGKLATSDQQVIPLLDVRVPNSDSFMPLFALTCCVGPFYLLACVALGLFVFISMYRWLTDRDLMSALRGTPNEFDLDDTASLEKAVEQTVRESLDSLGLESRVLMPPAVERPVFRVI